MVEEAYDGAGTGDDYITRYTFDDAGNRVLLTRDASPASAFGTDADGFLTIDATAFTADSTTSSVYDDNDRLLNEATDEDSDAVIDEFIQYDYAGTVQAAKTVHDGPDTTAPVSERADYSYNARGRQGKAEIDSDGDATVDVTTEYSYNDAGIRIKQIVTKAGQASSTTEFVINASNPTGYAQTIEEITDGSVTKTYTLGLDVISQAINDSGLTGTLRTLLYDGHGSVRQLVDEVGQVVKAALDSIGGAEVLKLDYTAYGRAINFAAATAVSSLLYSGEFTDATTGQQYLRARFYDLATGRFNRVDPFAGVVSEPQSLHKYLYGHGDPVTNIDPSGELIPLLLVSAIIGGAGTFAALGQNPLQGALAGLQAAAGFVIAPNKMSAFAGGVISAGIETLIVAFEGINTDISGGTFGENATDIIAAFSDGLFDTALDLYSLDFGDQYIFYSSVITAVRSLFTTRYSGPQAGSQGNNGTSQSLEAVISAGIEAVLQIALSDTVGFSPAIQRRLDRLISTSFFRKLISSGSGIGQGTDELADKLAKSSAAAIVDILEPVVDRVLASVPFWN